MHDELRSRVASDMPNLIELLGNLVRLPSVSAPGYDKTVVHESAETILGYIADAGFSNGRLLEVEGGNPAIFAEIEAPPGAPTVLLYAHYDVQPPGPAADWETGPYDPTVRDGRLYGRGASDDKAGIVMHLGAVRAHGGKPPVGVQLFFEGEEEAGSESLGPILEQYNDLLHPDVIVIGDGGNWAVGTPAFLTSLRGLVSFSVELRTLNAPVHSGQYGGVYPDAITAMARLISTLHDDAGNVAVAGLVSDEIEGGLDIPEPMARRMTGVVDGVTEIGTGSIPSRLWSQPSISVLAFDAPPVAEAINQLVPVATAKISLRTAPGQDTKAAEEALRSHLTSHAPWGTTIRIWDEQVGDASRLETDNIAVRAWTKGFQEAYGTDPVAMGAGGSIPFIATFAELFPGAPIIVIGCGDPTSAIHAPNESQDLGDLEHAVLSEAIAALLLADSSIAGRL
jgi:acetylornithine deacetylase/succinyl-diaminopimelate desuccinylase-like protein